jgi:hypothetical protein
MFSSIIARTSSADSFAEQFTGAVAQLGERMTGSHEVRGSIPLGSTKHPRSPFPLALPQMFRTRSNNSTNCGAAVSTKPKASLRALGNNRNLFRAAERRLSDYPRLEDSPWAGVLTAAPQLVE